MSRGQPLATFSRGEAPAVRPCPRREMHLPEHAMRLGGTWRSRWLWTFGSVTSSCGREAGR
jgi:hypothetical protein